MKNVNGLVLSIVVIYMLLTSCNKNSSTADYSRVF